MKFTFGKTKACEKLETLLEGQPWASRRVSRLLSSYSNKLVNITGAKDPETVCTCMELLRDFTLKRVDSTKLDPIVKTHTKNLVCYRYRVFLHEFLQLVPLMEKQGLTSAKGKV